MGVSDPKKYTFNPGWIFHCVTLSWMVKSFPRLQWLWMKVCYLYLWVILWFLTATVPIATTFFAFGISSNQTFVLISFRILFIVASIIQIWVPQKRFGSLNVVKSSDACISSILMIGLINSEHLNKLSYWSQLPLYIQCITLKSQLCHMSTFSAFPSSGKGNFILFKYLWQIHFKFWIFTVKNSFSQRNNNPLLLETCS